MKYEINAYTSDKMSKNTMPSARSATELTGRESWKVAKNLKNASTSFSCCAYSEDMGCRPQKLDDLLRKFEDVIFL